MGKGWGLEHMVMEEILCQVPTDDTGVCEKAGGLCIGD